MNLARRSADRRAFSLFFDEGKPGSGIARTKGLAEVVQIVKLHVRRLRGAVLSSGKYTYSAVSLFAGCGGSDLGLRRAQVDPIWANEKNESACQIFERLTGLETMHPGDIRGIRQFPRADILAGCYPCQGYSQGGRRIEGDKINFLYREYDRVLRQLRPLAFIVENVDGMRFAQNSGLLRSQLVRFRSAGYRVAWKVLDAKDYGVAQDRRRLFIVGIRSKEGLRYQFPEPTHGPGPNRMPYRTLRDLIWSFRKAPAGSYDPEPLHWYYLSR